MRSHRKDERGAIAILSGVLAIVLFGIGAVVIDLGQAWKNRALLQTSVDLAVMAAVAELDQESGCNEGVATTATEYLNTKSENQVIGQYSINLTDGNVQNGEVTCPGDWQVHLVAPASRVDYGLARVLSSDSTHIDVTAEATAQVKSPSQSSSLPMYAVAGCDTGHQTLTDPPPGPPPSTDPPALVPDGNADIKSMGVTPAEYPTGGARPFSVTVTGSIKGAAATTTGQVTFTNPDTGQIVDAGSPASMPVGPGYNSFSIAVPAVPNTVLDAGGIWWVRIKTESGNYSPTDEAEPFVVGDLLFCDGMVSGNFGTLKIARDWPSAAPANWLQDNIIHGMQPVLALNSSSAVPCSPVDSQHSPQDGTDCVSTDPGFPLEAATDGLIDGSGGEPGRLDVPTTPGCDRNGGDAQTSTSNLNDDVLACFITAGNSVGSVVAGTPGSLSGEIFRSPRFFQIPVLPEQAAHGASGAYPIIAFRPGFITDEPDTASTQPVSVTGDNGVTVAHGKVKELRVVLFPPEALPETAPPVGGEVEYRGHGTKILVLVD